MTNLPDIEPDADFRHHFPFHLGFSEFLVCRLHAKMSVGSWSLCRSFVHRSSTACMNMCQGSSFCPALLTILSILEKRIIYLHLDLFCCLPPTSCYSSIIDAKYTQVQDGPYVDRWFSKFPLLIFFFSCESCDRPVGDELIHCGCSFIRWVSEG